MESRKEKIMRLNAEMYEVENRNHLNNTKLTLAFALSFATFAICFNEIANYPITDFPLFVLDMAASLTPAVVTLVFKVKNNLDYNKKIKSLDNEISKIKNEEKEEILEFNNSFEKTDCFKARKSVADIVKKLEDSNEGSYENEKVYQLKKHRK